MHSVYIRYIMKTQTKLWALSYAVILPILLVGFILAWEKLLTTNQYVIVSMGCLSAISVFTTMMKLKEDTILKKHSVLITSFLISIISLVSVVLVVVQLDLTFEFIIFLGIILGSLLCIPSVDWNAYRKKKNTITEHQNTITSKY
jgi:hypothetical protein